jgi:hypothetical protein
MRKKTPVEAAKLLVEVERFLRITGMAVTAFGTRVCNNGHLVARLRKGYDVRTETATRARTFMANCNPTRRRK